MRPSEAALTAYFASRESALTAATRAALRGAGQELAQEANRQMRANFRRRPGAAKSRFFPATGVLPDAAIVSIKPNFLSVFENGATVKGDRFLVIAIAPFRRVGKRGWGSVYAALKSRYKIKIIPAKEGYLVTANGTPAYLLKKEVQILPRLNVAQAARRIGEQIPRQINQLLEQ